MDYAAVFVGGGIGAALRHSVNRAALAWLGPGFPYATLFVNVAGSVALGILAGLFVARAPAEAWRLFLTTGLLGGFTTFSAFSLDSATMWQSGDHAGLAVYVGASVALSIAGLFAGLALARALA
ncbi:MAG TPA: fluoride efflux transporter CrcB [Allosphingosinicella sp.]|nr:fluoride efflux transporter CrcB [Allosphingosinicella sp.]